MPYDLDAAEPVIAAPPLTPLGRFLADPVLALGDWARDHLRDIAAAHPEFDRREA